jgi:cell division protein FtsA
MYVAPIELSHVVLTEAEKRSGCALIDLGADTTTVAVYSKNILRHLVVIPIGCGNITKDIASLQMEDSEAEKMKLTYGSAYTENFEIDESSKYPIDQDRQVEARRFIEIVEGRLEEIIINAQMQIPSEYCDKLLGGIILTGGGSNMKNIERAFREHTRIEKIRIATFVTLTINSSDKSIKKPDGMTNTALGIRSKGYENCAGGELSRDLFGPEEGDSTETEIVEGGRPEKPGVLAADKAHQEKERQEKERQEKESQEEEAAEAAQRAKEQNKWYNKLRRGITNFSKIVVSPDE